MPTKSGQRKSVNIFAEPDSKAFGKLISSKVEELCTTNTGTAFGLHYSNVSVAYTHLYGLDIEGVGANAAMVTRSGEQGSIAELRIPATAGALTKVHNLVVGPELSWTAVATTTDYASGAEAITAKNALQYYWADQDVSTTAKGVAFEGLAFAEGALHVPWDEELGEEIGLDETDPEHPKVLKAGDIGFRPISTWDIIRDPTAKSYRQLRWIIVREWQNRFDVAARCPDEDTAQAALNATANPYSYAQQFFRPFSQTTTFESDLIPVYYLYHRRTGAVGRGRQTEFLEDGSVIDDAPLHKSYWKHLPVVRIAAGEYSGTPFPYSKYFATLGAAQAADGLYKDLLTNATATSGGLIYAESDSDTPVTELGGGPKVIYGKPGGKPPVKVDLQQSNPEAYQLIGRLRGEMQQILGLDSLTAGEKVGENLSGAAMALMTSTSVQNNSQLQAAWGQFVQTIGNVVLSHIQTRMKTPRKIALAGRSRADLVITTELSGDKVAGIDRLQVQLSPALQQTAAGKLELAQMLLKTEQGWIETPQQFQSVLDTGRADDLTQALSSELMLIASENEALGRGETVPVMLGDNHILHVKAHRAVTASITARQNPKVVQALQAHEAEHLKILQNTDANILKVFDQPSLAQPQAPQPPPVPDATKLGVTKLAVDKGWAQTPAQAQQVFDSAKLDAGNPPQGVGAPSPQQAAQTAAPSMPVNPSTGQPAAPAGGVMPPALAIKPK